MSALTKVFVVLLVILSMVTTSGMVVWVNRHENMAKTIQDMKTQIALANSKEGAAQAQVAVLTGDKNRLQADANRQQAAKQQEIDQKQQLVTDRDAQISQLQNNIAQLTAANATQSQSMDVAQKSLSTVNTQMAELRKSTSDLQNRYTEATFTINELQNKFQVTNRQWKDALEQIAQLQAEGKTLRERLSKAGVALDDRNLNNQPLVRIEGVVRDKQVIGGVPYATISVGSADAVTKGMQFKVIDPTQQDPFLGYLTVDRVEPHLAWGHLTGPRIGEVRSNVEVRTQL